MTLSLTPNLALFVVATTAGTSTNTSPSKTVDRLVVAGRRFHPVDDPTAAASVREPSAQARAFADLGTVLRTVPGVQVQRSGAPGSFIGASIRGGTLQQTAVFVGDLQISGADSGAFDLGILPPELFESIEVYRGGAPAWLSAGAIGGVIRLVPDAPYVQRPSEAAVQGGAGSFDARYASLRVRQGRGRARPLMTGGILEAENDYPFVDDNATILDPDRTDDDATARRDNADLLQAHGAQYTEVDAGPGRFSFLTLAIRRDKGEPGSAASPATRARRQRSFLFGSGGYTIDGLAGDRRYRLQLAGGLSLDDDRFEDPGGEIGIDRLLVGDEDIETELWTGQLRIAGTLQLFPWLGATAVGTARWEGITSELATGRAVRPPADRQTQAGVFELAAEGDVARRRLDVRASVRVQHTRSDASETTNVRVETKRIDRVDPTVRVAVRYDLAGSQAPVAWAFVGSFMNGLRLPSTLELFGDRANIRGNPLLEPERGQQADAGFVARYALRDVELRADVRLFGLWLDDLIVARRNSQQEIIPINERRGRVLGAEASAEVSLGDHLRTSGALTAQDSRNVDTGRELPFRAPFVVSALLSGRTGRFGPVDDLSAQVEVAHRAEMSIAPSGLERLAGRTTVDLGFEVLFGRKAQLYAELRDVFDARGADFLGFPLPGRRFELGLQLRETW